MVEDQIAANKRRTVLICLVMLLLLFAVVFALGLLLGAPPLFTFPIALILSVVYLAGSLRFSVQAVLSATGARPANPNVREEKLLMDRVEEMAMASGLPVPKVYVQDSHDINAFATGLKPQDAVVCATTGALKHLNQEELQGVIGHEMSHVLNRDVLVSTVTIAVVGSIAMLAEIGVRMMWFGGGRGDRRGRGSGGGGILLILALVCLVLAPIFSRMVYFAMQRRREYLADASGAYLTRNPLGLASALAKIKAELPDDPKGSQTAASLYIANPWHHVELDSIFATHPPIDRRIERLRQMAGVPPDMWEEMVRKGGR